MPNEPQDWEEMLRQGLDRVAGEEDEAPPSLESLQLLASQVLREQRRETRRQLALFWTVGAVLLSGAMYAAVRSPAFLLIWQGTAAVGILAGALVWRGTKGRVTS